MKLFLISDNEDTKIGLRLTGIEGIVVQSEEELKQVMEGCLKDPELAVVLLTEKLTSLSPDYIDEIKLNHALPLLVEIPDRHGSQKPADYITNYVRDAIGVKLS